MEYGKNFEGKVLAPENLLFTNIIYEKPKQATPLSWNVQLNYLGMYPIILETPVMTLTKVVTQETTDSGHIKANLELTLNTTESGEEDLESFEFLDFMTKLDQLTRTKTKKWMQDLTYHSSLRQFQGKKQRSASLNLKIPMYQDRPLLEAFDEEAFRILPQELQEGSKVTAIIQLQNIWIYNNPENVNELGEKIGPIAGTIWTVHEIKVV